MDKIKNKVLLYLGIGLGVSRIIISLIISKFNFDFGYFFDVFIFAYLYLWILLIRHKQVFSFRYIITANIFIAIIAIVIYDLFVLVNKHPIIDNDFFINRGVVAINILVISLFSSICYYFTQQLLKSSRK